MTCTRSNQRRTFVPGIRIVASLPSLRGELATFVCWSWAACVHRVPSHAGDLTGDLPCHPACQRHAMSQQQRLLLCRNLFWVIAQLASGGGERPGMIVLRKLLEQVTMQSPCSLLRPHKHACAGGPEATIGGVEAVVRPISAASNSAVH